LYNICLTHEEFEQIKLHGKDIISADKKNTEDIVSILINNESVEFYIFESIDELINETLLKST